MQKINLSGSVGINGKNNPADIKKVQTALNNILDKNELSKKLIIDGKLGRQPEKSKTVDAIYIFQKKHAKIPIPDGRIDANGRSHRKLNELIIAVSQTSSSFGMRLSNKGAFFLKQIEQLRLIPYDDQSGKPIKYWVKGATIGYGHLISESEWDNYKDGTTEQKANELFQADLKPFESSVNNAINVKLTQEQYDALVIFSFNIGIAAFKNSSAVKMVNSSDASTPYSTLEKAWKAWNKSQGKVNNGLINRRNAEWSIFHKGVYSGW